ncbi:MAG: bifunctional phosphoserine phosphatase/homoserine phosphotransferase ThrH [Caldilineaceae bacterium]|nr:bifunctional phosphoserine phosphatase/homoserine phosphotransferase ThrH [Caldilineaceae bacterium]
MSLQKPTLLAADFEGVFIPEIWIAVAERTGIEQLRLTTRDISNYDELMQMRLRIIREQNLTIAQIQAIIDELEPLPGAYDFMQWVRTQTQFIILTDSFYQFVAPFMPKLHYPTIFAHMLEIDDKGIISGYHLRTADSKRKAVEAFSAAGFATMATGDSYNDTTMLLRADKGVLFRPPPNVIAEFPQLPVTTEYAELKAHVIAFLNAA